MELKIKGSKYSPIILKNIRALREFKKVKVETIANQLGLSKGTYSKLENGNCTYLERYLEKIAEILGVECFDLAMENCFFNFVNQTQDNNDGKILSKDKITGSEQIIRLLEERGRERSEQLNEYRELVENWKAKYYRMKARLENKEIKYNDLADKFLKKITTKRSPLNKIKDHNSRGGGRRLEPFEIRNIARISSSIGCS